MSEPHRTLEGWYVLHDIRRLDWRAWKAWAPERRRAAIEEAIRFFASAQAVEDAPEGSSAVYSMLGHKGDLMMLHLRPTMNDLNALELAFARTALADVTERTYSLVSVTELGQYTADESRQRTPEEEAFIARRLKPAIPDYPFVSFYPMSKVRGEVNNWYTLPLDVRRSLMHAHGMVGRNYRGQVQQLISGSIGYDDWEWGVTLFAVDALPIKKIVQEMRFDEASAKYALFGPFYFGIRRTPEEVGRMLEEVERTG